MAWKIRKKPKQELASVQVGSAEEIASFLASKAEPFCPTCGGENDFVSDEGGSMWGCPLCDGPEQGGTGSGNN
jgi:putative hemolysin